MSRLLLVTHSLKEFSRWYSTEGCWGIRHPHPAVIGLRITSSQVWMRISRSSGPTSIWKISRSTWPTLTVTVTSWASTFTDLSQPNLQWHSGHKFHFLTLLLLGGHFSNGMSFPTLVRGLLKSADPEKPPVKLLVPRALHHTHFL